MLSEDLEVLVLSSLKILIEESDNDFQWELYLMKIGGWWVFYDVLVLSILFRFDLLFIRNRNFIKWGKDMRRKNENKSTKEKKH